VLTRKDIFSRIEQLAINDPEVQFVVRAAESLFWEEARTGKWLAWDPGENRDAPPPVWEAGFAYLQAVVPAHIACCRRLVRYPGELESYIEACEFELIERTIRQKLLPHSPGMYWISVRAVQQFEQAARNRLAVPLANFRAGEWSAVPAPVSLSSWGTHAPAVPGSEPAPKASPSEALTPTPVSERRSLVAAYKREFRRTVADICDRAVVDRSDFYKWQSGKLSDTSEKSIRIERELQTANGLRPAA
jgi:hypothetical protein